MNDDIPNVGGACSGITGPVWIALILVSGAAWTGIIMLARML